ncbi:hypothetical protein GS429_05535 [Natronorubrum sp. JWXQ-INN-674]|uniref:Uncharacterized protein n=2 Tax=Natronorubrum halalkaliphilum TaxID=2691917 RepID=A0A6B0VK82_9EURY|nr:hypothetical protein [Natronorubrum halalkaliphilum]MXV61535.1 hypothetical protein [Natronorubrum halalkaliphilum]
MWQDFVFLAGSVLSIVFLAPTVRDSSARIPLGSSFPSMAIGAIYSFTYATMGMRFSALGSAGVAAMWTLIVCYRAPGPQTGPKNIVRFVASMARRSHRLLTGTRGDQHAPAGREQTAD